MLELNIKTQGNPGSPTIVLLHGLFGSATNWGTIARNLGKDYQVVVPDLRNHGQSPQDRDCSYAAMAGDVLGLLDSRGTDSAILVGHSMGGKVAMHLALNHPQRVAGLAVVDMAPVNYSHDFQDVVDAFRAVDLGGVQKRADADAQMAPHVTLAGVRAFLLQNLVKRPDGWAWRVNLDALAAAQDEITGFPDQPVDARYRQPAAFIHGELSDYVQPAYEPEIRRLFPFASLCEVAAAGHWVYAEKPQGFMDCLERFLENLNEGIQP